MILTIGHSSHAWDKFVEMLEVGNVQTVIDVRSVPRSRFRHFDRAVLKSNLNWMGIPYLFSGDRLGGLAAAAAGYDETSRSRPFCEALDEAIAISRQSRVALLCAEHNPICCHRFLMISRELSARGEAVAHILRDGSIEEQSDTEARMRRDLKLLPGLLGDLPELTDKAYRAQVLKLGARP